jgi:hypothetical protein
MKTQISKAFSQKTSFQRRNKTRMIAAAAQTLYGYLTNLKTNHLNVTVDNYRELGNILNKLKSAKGSDVEYIRMTLVASLESLMATVDLLLKYKDLVEKYKATLAQANILDNVDTILEYLKNIKTTLFPDVVVTVMRAEIRQEYALYIQRYGPPLNGQFDVTLLANIMAEI